MDVRRIMIGAILAVLVSSPGFALAQGRGRGMGIGDSMGHDKGAMKQLDGMMARLTEMQKGLAALMVTPLHK